MKTQLPPWLVAVVVVAVLLVVGFMANLKVNDGTVGSVAPPGPPPPPMGGAQPNGQPTASQSP